MWNFLVSGLLVGATVVLYDGSPGYPDTAAQWRVAERTGTTLYGTSAAYVMACRKADVHPGRDFDLSRIACVATTGSPLPPDGFRWIHDEVAEDMWIASVSGGTDVCSCFAGAVPTLPVYIGELQAPGLGTDLQAWDPQGEPVVDEVGELIVARPMPSMPVRFWNDPDGSRYRDSYFEMFPGAWRHGDWITLTSRGTVVIHGRSDSTLNRQGVRMGSADIYEAVERLPEIRESLVIGVEQPDGGYWMPLFVHLAPGATLNEELLTRIKTTIRTQLSPRHVPDEIIEVPGVPHTLTGKRIEVPVKRLLQGTSLDKAVNPGSVDDVELLRYYERLAEEKRGAAQAGARLGLEREIARGSRNLRSGEPHPPAPPDLPSLSGPSHSPFRTLRTSQPSPARSARPSSDAQPSPAPQRPALFGRPAFSGPPAPSPLRPPALSGPSGPPSLLRPPAPVPSGPSSTSAPPSPSGV
ncbi:hypothetical protein SANT12839_014080 [Streptomyces antimycoticus]|uniref:AMP-dependent synthetase/ligase domain-containing protein n=1 Tax=Streptomyces antimycoticus TaxID=68175 RepID=A0A4D4K1G7_9ACTN|nr:hypothetical protein SANT12839_014080 [Streptomyces antimycoticus]